MGPMGAPMGPHGPPLGPKGAQGAPLGPHRGDFPIALQGSAAWPKAFNLPAPKGEQGVMDFLQDLSKSSSSRSQTPRTDRRPLDPFRHFLEDPEMIDLDSLLGSLWDPCGAPVGIIF